MTRGRIRPRWEYAVALLIGLAVVATSISADGATVPKPKPTATTKKLTTAFGKAQAAAKAKVVIVPFIRTLSYTPKSNAGCVAARPPHPANKKKHIKAARAVHPTCPAIFQMQRALKAAKFRKIPSTGVYGADTRDQVKRFQRAKHIPPSGVYGSRTHLALSRYYDLVGRQRLQTVAHDRKIVAITTAFTVVGRHAQIVGGTSLIYSQSSSRGFLPRYPRLPPATDCSGFVTWMFQSVGLPDPNGFNFRPVGYTGTLALHGVRVTDWNHLHVGDLVLYGGGYPYGHVTIVVDAVRRLVLSHGSRGVRLLAFNYRRVSVIRRYYS